MNHTKRVTSHGSVSIPVDLRRDLGIREKDPVDVLADAEGNVVIKPHIPRCSFCGDTEDIRKFMGRNICVSCAKEIFRLLKEETDAG